MTDWILDTWRNAQALAQDKKAKAALPLLEKLKQVWTSPPESPPQIGYITTLTDTLQEFNDNPPTDDTWLVPNLFYQHRLLLAWCYRQQEQWPQALQILEELRGFFPLSIELLTLLGRYYLWAGFPAQARQAWEQILILKPTHADTYADLAYLANQSGDYQAALVHIHQGLRLGATPELLQELLLTCAQGPEHEFRRALLEVATHYLSEKTFAVLRDLAHRLYQAEDFANAEYLSYHLSRFHAGDQTVLNLYVLSALQLHHYVPAIECLLHQANQEPFHPGLWFKLGMAYRKWRIPLFARHAFDLAARLGAGTEIATLATEQLLTLPHSVDLESAMVEIGKMILVNSDFREKLRHAPQAALAEYGITWSEELAILIKASIWTD